jgi:L-ascorbate metabolism protein UlaG (beta-lactamase superfamily)
MWRKRAKQAALVSAAVVAVGLASITWLWRDRPSLGDIDWPEPLIASAAVTGTVTVTWLGVSTLLFDDGETQILVDGFFSRPSLADLVLDRPIDNDAPMINYVLDEYRMRRLAAIIPSHSHFDHAMDIGAIANRTSASILGSESTAQIARGAGVPEDQIALVGDRSSFEFGRFTVTLVRSRHAPIGLRGSVPLAGTIDAPLTTPRPVSGWREGGSFTIVIAHPEGTSIVQGSAGLADGALRDVSADVVLMAVFGLDSLGKEYAERYWQSLVTATGATSVYPIHFDDFTEPFGTIVPGPKFLSDLAATSELLETLRDRWDTGTRLFLPEFGKRIVVYPQPTPDA